jgi:four helix bundle protein
MQDYRRLVVWQKAHRLTLAVYAAAASLKGPDSWALRSQVLRAAVSIPSNVAEGCGRGTDRDFRRFLYHSLGSCNELEYDLFLASDLGMLPEARHRELAVQLAEVRRMLNGLAQSLES